MPYTKEDYQQIIEIFFQHLEQKDITSWMKLWAEEGLTRFPYAHQMFDRELRGKKAIEAYWSGSPELFERIHFPIEQMLIDPEQQMAVVLFASQHTLKDQQGVYEDRQVGILKFDAHLKITSYEEFFDPITLGQTFGMLRVEYLD